MKKSGVKAANITWAVKIAAISLFLSMLFNFGAESALNGVNLAVAFLILFFIILIGILFDILGVATTTAVEKPFHAMSTKRVRGARQALELLRNADKVSNFCNDVIGDICGIISGSTAAIIVSRTSFENDVISVLFPLVVTGIVAGLTIGGKAIGKGFAIHYANEIIAFTGRVIHIFRKK